MVYVQITARAFYYIRGGRYGLTRLLDAQVGEVTTEWHDENLYQLLMLVSKKPSSCHLQVESTRVFPPVIAPVGQAILIQHI